MAKSGYTQSNASKAIYIVDSGITIYSRDSQAKKALSSMTSSLSGRTTSRKFLQFSKVLCLIIRISALLSIRTPYKFSQFSNAPFPISRIVQGISTDAMSSLPANAPEAISVTVYPPITTGIITSTSPPS